MDMRKEVRMIGIVMVLLLMGLVPFAAAEDTSTDTTDAVLAKECDWMTTGALGARVFDDGQSSASGTTATSSAVKDLTPWWVDIVNAEDDDISVEDEDVYIAVLDTGLLGVQANYLPQDRLALGYGKGFSVSWTWDNDLKDYVAGSVYDTRGYTTRQWGSGHGTHVTSTITGFKMTAFDGLVNVKGVAPKAKVIPVLVLDYWLLSCPDPTYPGYNNGYVILGGGTWEMVAAGIKYAADLTSVLDAPLIISMSLGGSTRSDLVEDAIDYAIGKGCIVVASAGNEGKEGMVWPGAYSQVISCAAAGWTETFYIDDYTDPAYTSYPGYTERFWRSDLKDVPEKLNTKDEWGNNKQIFLETFSSRPNKTLDQKQTDLDIACPGASILGPFKNSGFYFDSSGKMWYYGPGIYWLDGTSMAVPHASSIASMVLQNHPTADQDDMETILKKAAKGETLPCDGAWESDYKWYANGLTWHKWNGVDYGAGFLKADSTLAKADDYF